MTIEELILSRSYLPKDGTYTMYDHLTAIKTGVIGTPVSLVVTPKIEQVVVEESKAYIKVKEDIIKIRLRINTEDGILEGSTMGSTMVTKQGDSTDVFEITIDGLRDYTNYRAEVQVLVPKTNEVKIAKEIVTPVSNKMSIAFAPEQTALLTPGSYNVVTEVIKEENSVIVFRRELTWTLKIQESLVN